MVAVGADYPRRLAETLRGRDQQNERHNAMTAETEQVEGMVRGDGDIGLTATDATFVTVPADVYTVEFLKFEDGPEGDYGPSIRLVYSILEGDYAGETIDELASLKSGPRSKLRQRAEMLQGRAYETGESIRLVPLFGKRVRAVVKVNENDRNRIESLMPLPAPRPRPAAPARPQGARPAARSTEEQNPF